MLDIGVSSMQLDDPARGFSFQGDGPLDMRMSAATGPPPPTSSTRPRKSHLADILFHLGEERRSRAIARAIVAPAQREARSRARRELAELAARVLGREKIAGRHAATRTFQALRIYVNDELGELARGLAAAERVLAAGRPAGRRHLPFAGGRHVKHFLSERADAGTAGLAPSAAGRITEVRPSFRFDHQRPVSPHGDESSPQIPARARPSCGSAIRTEAPPGPTTAPIRQFRAFSARPAADDGNIRHAFDAPRGAQ